MKPNTYLRINVNKIIENIRHIKNKISDKSKLYIVVKSNFYNFGNELLKFITQYVDGLVFGDFYELSLANTKCNLNDKPIILLYQNLYDQDFITMLSDCNNSNIYITVMNEEELEIINNNNLFAKTYIRVDPYLGNHGIDFKEVNKIKDISKFKGILIHLNEWMDEVEEELLVSVIDWVKSKNISVNIGGSAVVNYERMLKYNLDFRLVMNILTPRSYQDLLYHGYALNARILKKIYINSPIKIGYKSSQVTLSSGTLLTLSLGYGNFSILPKLFEANITIKINNHNFVLPCYPCMNTCWLYCEDIVQINEEYVELFNEANSLQSMAYNLDIDVDEILTALSEQLFVEYICEPVKK